MAPWKNAQKWPFFLPPLGTPRTSWVINNKCIFKFNHWKTHNLSVFWSMVTWVHAMFDWKFVLWCLENFRFFFPIPPTHKVLPRNGTHPTQNLTRNLTKKISVQKNVLTPRYFPKTVKNRPKMTKILTSIQPTT